MPRLVLILHLWPPRRGGEGLHLCILRRKAGHALGGGGALTSGVNRENCQQLRIFPSLTLQGQHLLRHETFYLASNRGALLPSIWQGLAALPILGSSPPCAVGLNRAGEAARPHTQDPVDGVGKLGMAPGPSLDHNRTVGEGWW